MLMLVPPSLTFTTLGTQQTFEVDESGYTGTFTLTDTDCVGVAAYGPTSGPGPSLIITVTSISFGTCHITVTDTNGQSAVETVTVT
jgi:hypothetical protein